MKERNIDESYDISVLLFKGLSLFWFLNFDA